ncbi:response regulator transcription factor [Variovorax sp. PAMC26660]|uniref:response regulator transcription factor n=1 Tax=Variovorax sp. PAMC26660 TaxID=2762322 RepID=UPI0039659E56
MAMESGGPARTLQLGPEGGRDAVLPAPVLVVEDDALMQRRIYGVLAALGYGNDALVFAKSIAQARAHMAAQPHALALVDIGLPDGSGVSLIEELRADDPALPILVISAWSTEDVILNALRSGATGYVLKERDDIELSLSVRSVLRGGAPIDPFIARRILELAHSPPTAANDDAAPAATHATAPASPRREEARADGGRPDVDLTPREREILQFVAQGLTNREIAQQLLLSRHTVECHIKHIYQKLAVSSRTKAVFEARSRGLLP